MKYEVDNNRTDRKKEKTLKELWNEAYGSRYEDYSEDSEEEENEEWYDWLSSKREKVYLFP